MSTAQEMRKQISHLEYQAAIERISVSKACQELIKYCQDHQKVDVLVIGSLLAENHENPFLETHSCSIF